MHACFLFCSPPLAHRSVARTAILLSALILGIEGAAAERGSRGDDASPPEPEVPAPADPYLAYLDEVAKASPSCKTHAAEVKELLNAQTQLVSELLRAGPESHEKLEQQLVEMTNKIAAAEAQLAECFGLDVLERESKMWSPNAAWDRETKAPAQKQGAARAPAAGGDEAAAKQKGSASKEQPSDSGVVITPPPPPTERSLPPVPPAPERESTYTEFLRNQAGDSTYAGKYATDVQRLLAERRQLAVRFLRAPESSRRHLNIVMGAINHRLRISVMAIHEANALGTAS